MGSGEAEAQKIDKNFSFSITNILVRCESVYEFAFLGLVQKSVDDTVRSAQPCKNMTVNVCWYTNFITLHSNFEIQVECDCTSEGARKVYKHSKLTVSDATQVYHFEMNHQSECFFGQTALLVSHIERVQIGSHTCTGKVISVRQKLFFYCN